MGTMSKEKQRDDVLATAIRQAGGVAALSHRLGITVQAVSKWPRVPAERVLDVERASGVSRYKLRPDIYGPAPSRQRGRVGNAITEVAA